jgi:RHS repeat-associated protein
MNHQLNSAGVNNPLFQYVPQAGTVSYGAANADNGLTTMTASSGSATMTYDGNYNLTYDGTNTLSYDVENRMVQAENPAWGASTYLYDPLGERKQKVVGVNTVMPVATDFVLAGGEEIADYYETSATWRLTVRGAGGLPLVTVVPAAGGGSEEIVYVHHDVKGSTVALTVAGGSGVGDSYTYSDYGQPQSGSWLAYQYAGYRYDSETGLYYMPARYYSPVLGRFLQTDPSGFGGGLNLYAYAENDPINSEDHSGQSPDGGGLTIKLSETIPTLFGGLFGVPSLSVSGTSSNLLTASTLSALGLSTSLQVTAYQVAAAVLTQEFRGQGTDAVEAGAVIVLNRMIHDEESNDAPSQWGRGGVSQAGLSSNYNILLKIISAPNQFRALAINPSNISNILAGTADSADLSEYNAALGKLTSISIGSASLGNFQSVGGYNLGWDTNFVRNRSGKARHGGILINQTEFY